jgi:anaerobic selenocysteine-containing dehydrogenase
MTNEEAAMAKRLFGELLNAKIDVMVDAIGPIKMKSRTEWLLGTQAAPNFRGVSAAVGESRDFLNDDFSNAVLYVCDAEFSERAKDPAVIANLRKAKFLIVHSWDANHPLNDFADVLLPACIHAEKDGTFTNLQGTDQEIHQAYSPKGQAVPDLEIFRRIGERLFPAQFREDAA